MLKLIVQDYAVPLILILGKIFLIIIPLLLVVAYLTYAERRIIGLMQLRKGPNVVGPFGLLQPIADAIKLFTKETIIPNKSDKILFILAPIITFVLSIIGWAVIPFSDNFVLSNINVGILYIFAVSSLGVYGIIIAGWASNSKYAFLGAIRSSAQMISYELSIGLILVSVLLTAGTLNISEIVEVQKNRPMWIDLLMMPLGVVFYISMLAETNRLPFDLPEAEAELVAGYNVEYSSMTFALFFLGEYANMLLASAITSILFMGGYLPPFGIECLYFIPGPFWLILKISFLLFIFLWIRASLPRYRYDQLMRIGWKSFLPFSLFWMILIASLLFFTDNLPN
ncbi:NADH-quinone oxidoreductase subunit NuoH [Rickettsia endosymbiont of Cardiosporidium cionae]|uniref:NADH-quinone oxidoreductase subunit NuoH n=1 Tax=Rickettsia endosymbiont of Cardiosporidium cionae TaxID=2777155 RepID=UPI00189553DB|nr:NADH-quinone oxidoreductase subunit NuoH [Rickettsia endosymbiont of Cardiosporidium cionae]KAF8818902.1 NADH-quinone oxidoreductase subunit H [Rickettsia endosymbiont of Cardiosporidium cionae]